MGNNIMYNPNYDKQYQPLLVDQNDLENFGHCWFVKPNQDLIRTPKVFTQQMRGY